MMQQLPPGFVIDGPPQGNTVITKRVNPAEQRGTDLRNQMTEVQIAKMLEEMKKGDAPKLPTGYRMSADGTRAELIPGVLAPDTNDKNGVTAKIRADALQAFNDATALRRSAKELRDRYASGPGATSGFGSLYDYLPTESNQGFDEAAQRARGYVKRSLGFTGGEGNTVAESSSLYDPYLPSTWDKDGNIIGKISALEGLAADAERKAIATLGGVPDQYGNVTQAPQAQPAAPQQNNNMSPAGVLPPQNGGPRMPNMVGGLPQGTDIQFNFAKPDGGFDRNAWLMSNYGITPNQEAGITAFLKANRGNPNFSYKDLAAFYKGIGAPPPVEQPELIDRIRKGNVEVTGYSSKMAEDLFNTQMAARTQQLDTTGGAFDTFGRTAADALTFGNADRFAAGMNTLTGDGSYSENLARQRFETEASRNANPLPAFLGDVTGVIGATAGTARAGNAAAQRFFPAFARQGVAGTSVPRTLLNDASYGAAYSVSKDQNPLTGAATAATGSLGGQILGKGLQKGFTGVTDPAVQYLTERGVPLSIGEMFGNNSIIGRNMQKLESLPGVGDLMAARRADAKDAVFRGTLEDAIAPSGQQLAGQGGDALASAQAIKNQAYKDAYSNINAPIDAQYVSEVAPFIRTGRGIYGDTGQEFGAVVKDDLRPLFGPNRTLDGTSAQEFGETINNFASDFAARGAYGNKAANQLRGIGDATEGLVERTNPGAIPAIRNANQINANLTPIENAMITAKGVPTPVQLRAAITNNTKKFGGRAAAARGDKIPDIVKYAAENAPNISNSGTSDRFAAIAPFILPTALGGSAAGVGTFTDNPGATGFLATLAAMSTKQGQKALQKAVTSRSPTALKVGGLFGSRKAQKALGAGGAGALLSLYGN